jgi:hypothetical protein
MAGNNVAALQQHMSPTQRPGSQATQIEQSRAIAEVQAMVVVAQRVPRSETDAIQRITEACGQLRLAERAFFKFSRGGSTVAGSSIHLATDIARCWGNMLYGVKELARDDAKSESEMVAYAWDVQTNTRAETSFIVPHKRDKSGGPVALTDMRDIYENNANNAARRLREMIFRVIPPHVKALAEELCRETLQRGSSTEPLAKQLADTVDALAGFGINKARIEAKLGLKIEAMTPVDLANLRVSFFSLRRQEVTAEEEFPTVAAAALSAELQGHSQSHMPPTQKAPETTLVESQPGTPPAAEGQQASQPGTQPQQTGQSDLLNQDPTHFVWIDGQGAVHKHDKPSAWIEAATKALGEAFEAHLPIKQAWEPNAKEWSRVQRAMPQSAKARQAIDAFHIKLDELMTVEKDRRD